jgi:RimJ/RimL family protein N-acetyltransferase
VGVVFEHKAWALRDLELSDAPQLFERFLSRPNAMHYMPIPVQGTVQGAEALIDSWKKLGPGIRAFAIYCKSAPSRLVGIFTLSMGPPHAVALSLMIERSRFAMGAGAVLAPQFVHFLLAHEHIKRVWAYTDVDNKGVANLLRHMGARCEGVMFKYAVHPNISDEPRNCLLWSMTKR